MELRWVEANLYLLGGHFRPSRPFKTRGFPPATLRSFELVFAGPRALFRKYQKKALQRTSGFDILNQSP
jgi:hypothetical protein